MKDSGMSK